MSEWRGCELDTGSDWYREGSPESQAVTARDYAEQAKTYKNQAAEYAETAQIEATRVELAVTTAESEIESAKATAVAAVSSASSGGVSSVEAAASSGVSAIDAAKVTAVSAVQSEGTSAVDAVDAEKGTALASISSAASDQVSAVESAGSAQIAAVESAGDAKISVIQAAGISVDDAVAEAQAASTEAQSAATTATTALTNASATLESIRTDGAAYVSAISSGGSSALSSVQSAASTAISTVESAVAGVQSEIATYKNDAVAAVVAAGATATEAASAASASAATASAAATQTETAVATHDASIESHADIRAALTIESETRADAVTTLNSGIATLSSDLTDAKKALKVARRDVQNLQDAARGTLYKDISDERTLHSKTLGDAEVCGSDTTVLPNGLLQSISGKTVVWNQKINLYLDTPSAGGVTATIRDDGGILLSGVCQYNANLIISRADIEFIKDHIYYISSGYSNVLISNTDAFLQIYDSESGYYIQTHNSNPKSRISKCTKSGNSGLLRFRVNSGVDYTGVVIYPMLSDLTQMLGITEEAQMSIDAFEALIDTSKYHPYNAGTLMSLPVKSVQIDGKNLFDIDKFEIKPWVVNAKLCYFNLKKNTAYTCSSNVPKTSTANIYFNGSITPTSGVFINESKTITTGSDGVCYIAIPTDREYFNGIMNGTYWVQLEEGSTATAYSPKCRSTLVIPQSVKALTGYGWSAGSVCNEVDWSAKTYTQRVGKVDLGTLNWTRIEITSGVFAFESTAFSVKFKAGVSNFVSNNYICNGIARTTLTSDKMMSAWNASTTEYFGIRDDSYTDATAFKTALSGVFLYYELATPIVTDISDILPDNLLTSLETGGTITFVSDGVDPSGTTVLTSDEQSIPVPNSIAYQTKIAS